MQNYSDERKDAICARLQEIEANRNSLVSEMNIIQLRLDEMSFLKLFYMEKLEEINRYNRNYEQSIAQNEMLEKLQRKQDELQEIKPLPVSAPVTVAPAVTVEQETPTPTSEPLVFTDSNLKRWEQEENKEKETRKAAIISASITQQNNELKRYKKGYATEEIRSLVFDYLKENGKGNVKEMYNALNIEHFMNYKAFCNVLSRLASANVIKNIHRGSYALTGSDYKVNKTPAIKQADVLEYVKMILEEKGQVKVKELHKQIESLIEGEYLNIGSLYFYMSTWTKEGIIARTSNGFYSLPQ